MHQMPKAIQSSAALHWNPVPTDDISKLSQVVWGGNSTDEVFLRWAQGFKFSEYESTALMQVSGGPCAVIAPVQAFILKNALFTSQDGAQADINNIQAPDNRELLIRALSDIIRMTWRSGSALYLVSHSPIREEEAHTSTSEPSPSKRTKILSFETFHSSLRYVTCTIESLAETLPLYMELLEDDYGVLSFLYSAILTSGLSEFEEIVKDTGDPLIHPTHGHGGQSVVNLLITGEATPHVFDGEQDAGGINLKGISGQSPIGFLSLLESYNYLQVGWNLKSPQFPIWILGSETHLTVLFSTDLSAVAEDKRADAMRVINSWDTERNGFVQSANLADIMRSLNLICEPQEYVDVMMERMDTEGLGIILTNTILEEFFPAAPEEGERSFPLLHYNGIKRSHPNNQVEYVTGEAKISTEMQVSSNQDMNSDIIKCLHTKWPSLTISWASERVPSVN